MIPDIETDAGYLAQAWRLTRREVFRGAHIDLHIEPPPKDLDLVQLQATVELAKLLVNGDD